MATKPLSVIDTNVLVAGLRSKRGWSFELLTRVGGETFDYCVSVPLLCEYEEVLKRMAEPLGLDFAAIDALVNSLCDGGRKTLIYFQIGPLAPDPDDSKVLELAVAANADFIITFNKRHFREAERYGVKVCTPLEFLVEMGIAS